MVHWLCLSKHHTTRGVEKDGIERCWVWCQNLAVANSSVITTHSWVDPIQLMNFQGRISTNAEDDLEMGKCSGGAFPPGLSKMK